ncbi:MAG: GspH/FimT family pseudopilin [Pseudomonadota bacterium]|nr:GspH/FimT family pseudopilin [Xanthomonadaceae bacterium]MDE2248025.1 GspH/FimT family pseudopilin [Xanthomonadaceae bacterium]MDE3209502.1 GspH/FimT family pseudopilin [Pseudomonadota bacterium]
MLMPRSGAVAAGCRRSGFTLVELMITMTVALVLVMIAVPSFKTMTLSNKLTTVANDMVGAINLARMEAIQRNAASQLCSDSAASNTSDTLGTACNTSTQPGAVYVLIGGTTPTAHQVRTAVVGIVAPLKLNGSMQALRYSGQGLAQAAGTTTPYAGLVADICTSSISTNNHRLINMTAGSILVTTTTTGACP